MFAFEQRRYTVMCSLKSFLIGPSLPLPLFLYFCLFNRDSIQLKVKYNCQLQDSKRGSLVLEVIALPTEPQPSAM